MGTGRDSTPGPSLMWLVSQVGDLANGESCYTGCSSPASQPASQPSLQQQQQQQQRPQPRPRQQQQLRRSCQPSPAPAPAAWDWSSSIFVRLPAAATAAAAAAAAPTAHVAPPPLRRKACHRLPPVFPANNTLPPPLTCPAMNFPNDPRSTTPQPNGAEVPTASAHRSVVGTQPPSLSGSDTRTPGDRDRVKPRPPVDVESRTRKRKSPKRHK
ncbi:putative uncharacterized protein DDB_G0290521 [Schistocerca piceifrons]|uniref:putative uncharacterized protein DDB_G0290521 n=1 Tax=Schistocerca piceifrons TaxID=274613 RepID=UPI001F5F1B8C|nr:putative uncharacterized protein DDB_G0290521 [Schistocerca piceifrons]